MSWRRGQAYAQDLRERVLAATDLTLRQAAARFSVSPSFVAKARARLRDTGQLTPGPQHNLVPPRLLPLHDALRARVAAEADRTVAELHAWVAAEHGVRVSHPVMWEPSGSVGCSRRTGSVNAGYTATCLRWRQRQREHPTLPDGFLLGPAGLPHYQR